MPAELGIADFGKRMADYVSADDRQALPSIVAEVERRLADAPRGQSHGDFWSENFLGSTGSSTRCWTGSGPPGTRFR